MKRIACFIIVLTAIEQLIKLLIAQFYMGMEVDLIPNILRFHPVQNTNLLWVAALAGHKPSVLLVVFFQAFVAVFFILMYRYLSYGTLY